MTVISALPSWLTFNPSKKTLRGFFGLVTLLVIWETGAWVTKWVAPGTANTILPSLEYILTDSLPGFAGFASGGYGNQSYPAAFWVLGKHSLITGARVITGTIGGIVLGVGLGLIMAWNSLVKRFIYPVVQGVRHVPLLALIPLFLLWFGGSETGNFIYIVFGISVMIVVNTVNAVSNVASDYALFAETLGASRGQVFRTVILPAIIPELLGGIRVSLGLAWAITLGAELLAAQSGLGRLLVLSQYFLYTGRMVIITALFMLYSLVLNYLVVKVGRYFTRWQP